MTIPFVMSSALAAALLFAVQPMIAKMLLPLLGGAPAVWTTCLLFFQAALLLGYGYVHVLARLKPRSQLIVHAGLLGLGAASLPFSSRDAPTETQLGAFWVLSILTRILFVPTFALSASAPLIQSWFSRFDQERSPYPLYAASNVGSLAALLGYPLLIEPRFPLLVQAHVWHITYAMSAMLTVLCGAVACLRAPESSPAEIAARAAAAPTIAVLFRWAVLAFVPTGLLMGATSYASTDLAALPLLWVVPLSVYLITYIVAFSGVASAPSTRASGTFVLLSAILVFLFLPQVSASVPLVLVHWVYLALGGLIFHRQLAASQPPPAQLTWFYLAIALGGALAGVLHAIIAPLVFSRVLEYPLTMALAVACLPVAARASERERQERFVAALGLPQARVLGASVASPWPRRLDALVPAALALASVLLARVPLGRGLRISLCLGVPLVLGGLLSLGRRTRFALTLVALIVATQADPQVLARERSFLGTLRVENIAGYRVLFHGTIIHGRQSLAPSRRHEPTTYYSPGSPLSRLFAMRHRQWERARIGVIGLGVGTLAAYAQPGQRFRFYELDPLVLRFAREYFTYLRDSKAPIEVVLGDGRLSLAREKPQGYDLLVADAFSSDAVPLHLLTREALSLYMRALKSDGLLVVNATNRYLRIDEAAAALAHDAGLVSLVARDRVFNAAGRVPSTWVVIARKESHLADLRADPGFVSTTTRLPRVWTDDCSSILSALRTQR